MRFTHTLIIGAGGQVAKAIASAMPEVEILFSSSSDKAGAIPCNLADPDSIQSMFESVKNKWPDKRVEVFLPGALTHVDRCEIERSLCESINTKGPILVAEHCKKAGFGLTFFSSEYVFGEDEYQGGKVGPFKEGDSPNPCSWYGHCKLLAEQGISAILGAEALIVRTTMVFSYDPPSGLNFLMQYLKQFEMARNGSAKTFRIPADQISTPSYAPSLGQDVVKLRQAGIGGIIHLACTDLLSRRDLVKRVADEFGYEQELNSAFDFAPTAELKQIAKRPLSAGLSTERAKSLGLHPISLKTAFADVKKLMAR